MYLSFLNGEGSGMEMIMEAARAVRSARKPLLLLLAALVAIPVVLPIAAASTRSSPPVSTATREMAAMDLADEPAAPSAAQGQLPSSASEYRLVGRVNEEGQAEMFAASADATAAAGTVEQQTAAANPAGCTLTAFDPNPARNCIEPGQVPGMSSAASSTNPVPLRCRSGSSAEV